MIIVLHLIVNTMAVLAGAYLLKGVRVDSVGTAVVVAIVLGLLNTFIRPLLVFFTLPVTILTLGLFLLVINAFLIQVAAKWVSGFQVDTIWWAMAYSVVVSLVVSLLHLIIS